MLLALALCMFSLNAVALIMSFVDLWSCDSDSEVEKGLERWWRIFRYVIGVNILVSLYYFWRFYSL